MKILGISCFYHDSAASLLVDGEIIACAQEERFSRKKHDPDFPKQAVDFCLRQSETSVKDLDYVVFYDKPFVKFERILETGLAFAPRGITQFIQAVPVWLKQKLWISELIKKNLDYKGKILFSDHHESHAASAFYPSPFQEAAFLTIDGVGEWETASFGVGKDNQLDIQHCLCFPHSLGLLYSAFTYYCGFRVNSGEYKLMGLAPYGKPVYKELILNELIDLKDDGSFKMNMKYFGYCNSLRMTNKKFHRLFGAPPRKPETKMAKIYMDVAASIQEVTEEIMLKMANYVYRKTGQDKLCLAGGVALNCVGNGRILRQGPFKEIWVQPASGDAGGSLGAALLIWYKYLGNGRKADGKNDSQKASLLGPFYSDSYIEEFLKDSAMPYKRFDHNQITCAVAELIGQGKVVGWFQGRMEFGPRALGSRSILGDARNPEMQSKMNLKIKYRESFRPFAPSVLREKANEWFDLEKESPYMLLVASVKEAKKIVVSDDEESEGFAKLKTRRSQIPAVTHVDYSARIQTVKREDNPVYYDLIDQFYQKTGCPVIINTSFNVRGEPLVESPQDAFRCFMRTEMDYLAIGSFLLDKSAQKKMEKDNNWRNEFQID